MNTGVTIAVIWLDDDFIQVRVEASNGRFAGTAECYCRQDTFPRLAAAARGFPASSDDRREMEIGTFDPSCAGGGVRLGMRCVDRVGHTVVDVVVRADSHGETALAETASFSVPVEPAAIDEFVAALGRMRSVVGSVAHLRSATQDGAAADDCPQAGDRG